MCNLLSAATTSANSKSSWAKAETNVGGTVPKVTAGADAVLDGTHTYTHTHAHTRAHTYVHVTLSHTANHCPNTALPVRKGADSLVGDAALLPAATATGGLLVESADGDDALASGLARAFARAACRAAF